MTVVNLQFSGINCSGCMTGIRHAMRHLKVSHFEYDDATQKGQIVYDQSVTDLKQVIEIVKRFGLEAKVIETIEK